MSVLPLFELTVEIQACLEVVEVTSASESLLFSSGLLAISSMSRGTS